MKLENFAHACLSNLPVGISHAIGKIAMMGSVFSPGECYGDPTKLFGFNLKNPLGLAAGFDNNGEIVDCASRYGFGWVEVGSMTYHGSPGNRGKTTDKLEEGVWNRMGLAGEPAHLVIERLEKKSAPFAINIAKTNNPEISGDRAIEDIASTYALAAIRLGGQKKTIYAAFNISCPDTEERKSFEEEPEYLNNLLDALDCLPKTIPRLLKISPNLSDEKLRDIYEIADHRIDGYVCCNTLRMPHPKKPDVIGGGSGHHVRALRQRTIKYLREELRTKKVIIGSGGISTGLDGFLAWNHGRGADAFQAYDGFVYKYEGNPNAGPNFAHQFNREFSRLKSAAQKALEMQRR